MKNKKGKDVLKKAFSEYDRIDFENLPDMETEVPDDEFFENELQKILQKRQRNSWKTFSKHAIGIAAAFMIFLGSLTVVADGIVVSWISEFYETHVKIYFEDDDVQKAPTTLETIYMPTYIPDGYILKQHLTEIEWAQSTWLNEFENRISLYQNILDNQITIDTENSNFQTLFVDDLKIAISFAQDKKSYFWNTNEYFFSLITSKDISDEEIILIIKSLQKYETP